MAQNPALHHCMEAIVAILTRKLVCDWLKGHVITVPTRRLGDYLLRSSWK